MKVGLIGCGRIALEAHLPAYKKYGVEVVAVCDIIEERAKNAAKSFDVPFFCADLQELAALDAVELIDIATTPINRLELLRQLYAFNKPLLIQKPLSYNLEEAKLICNEIDNAGIKAAVNHNARWSPVNLKIQDLLKQNSIGELYQIHHINRFNEDLRAWYTDIEDYLFLDHGLHYIDLVRLYTGQEPTHISALSTRKLSQTARCDLSYSIQMRFNNNLLVSLYFNNSVPAPQGFDCKWFLDGDNGMIKSTLDSIEVVTHDGGNDYPMTKLDGEWVPEGFWGTYSQFVESIKQNVLPQHNVRDHLKSFAIASAAASSSQKRGEWIQIY